MKSGLNFLLVDDDPFVRRAISSLLSKNFPNAQVFTTAAIEEALAKTEEIDCDLILLDLSLGKESGLTIVKQLRISNVNIPILILSSLREEEAALSSMKAGADGFLCKDYAIETDKLAKAVEILLSGGKYLSDTFTNKLKEYSNEEDPVKSLSQQEAQVFLLIARGNSAKEISHQMSVHEKTVRTYRVRLLEKLKLKTDAEVVRFAIQNGIIN